MSDFLTPRLDILPAPQRLLWPQLRATSAMGMVLYGGTAIALRFGHRVSIDFDFFTDQPLDHARLRTDLPFAASATVLQDRPDTLTLLASANGSAPWVKVSFFGNLNIGRIGRPQTTQDGVLQIASVDDLLVTKLKVVLQRVEAKDYQDIAAVLAAGAQLEVGLAGASAMYGTSFQPSECLKALVYFKGGDLDQLSSTDRDVIISRVSAVHALPKVAIMSMALSS